MSTTIDAKRPPRWAKCLAPNRGPILGVVGLVAGWLAAVNLLAGGVAVTVGVVLLLLAERSRRLIKYSSRSEIVRQASALKQLTATGSLSSTLADTFGLGAPWRVSLYELRDQSWHRVLRDSNYAPYRSSGRVELPADEGVLAWAAKTGGFTSFVGLPDPAVDFASYSDFHASRAVPRGVVEALKMKSRAYACAVVRSDGDDSVDIALVVESEDPSGVVPTQIERYATRALLILLHRIVCFGPVADRISEGVDRHIDE